MKKIKRRRQKIIVESVFDKIFVPCYIFTKKGKFYHRKRALRVCMRDSHSSHQWNDEECFGCEKWKRYLPWNKSKDRKYEHIYYKIRR